MPEQNFYLSEYFFQSYFSATRWRAWATYIFHVLQLIALRMDFFSFGFKLEIVFHIHSVCFATAIFWGEKDEYSKVQYSRERGGQN